MGSRASDPPADGVAPPARRRMRLLRWPLDIATKLVRVVPDAVQHFYTDRCPLYAAGIAYRVLFSIAPLAIVLVSIFGLVLQDESIRRDVVSAIVDALPVSVAGRKDVEKAITAIATPTSAVGLASILVFAWAATGMMAAVRGGLEAALQVTSSRPAARGKLVDLVLIVAAAALVLATVSLTLLGDVVRRATGGLGEAVGLGAGTVSDLLLRAAWFALSVGVVLLLYRFVPARRLRSLDSLAGAIVTGLLLQLISLASGYVYGQATNLSVVYGSLTAALVFLYSVYLYAFALLFGAEFAGAWSRPAQPGGPPLGTRVKETVFGLFVRQDEPAPESRPDRKTRA